MSLQISQFIAKYGCIPYIAQICNEERIDTSIHDFMHDCQNTYVLISVHVYSFNRVRNKYYNINHFVGEFRKVLSKSEHQISVGKKYLNLTGHKRLAIYKPKFLPRPMSIDPSGFD